MAKNEVQGRVQQQGNSRKIFVIQADASGEGDVRLHFDSRLGDDFQVVKLDSADLPTEHDGKAISWINYWGIKDATGGWAGSVGHTAFFKSKPPDKEKFVYVDGDGNAVKDNRTPADADQQDEQADPPVTGMVKVHFDTGDPAAGWR